MKFVFSSIIFLFFLHTSCVDSALKNKKITSYQSSFNPLFDQLIDSFLLELDNYDQVNEKTNDTIKLIAYVKLEESLQNQSFKIHMEGVLSDSLLNSTTINYLYKKNNRYICIDYNISTLTGKQHQSFSVDSIIKNSKILNYNKPVRDIPSWLFLIKKNQLIKLNKHARSCFSNIKDYVSREETNKLKFYPVDEWGDVYDEMGNKIDSLR